MPVGVQDPRNRRRPFAMGSMLEYDLIVIGSGPGGQKAAIAAAKLGKTVAVVERGRMLGGVCVNTGTIPSKTLREAVVYLTGMSQRELYGASYRVKEKITPADLLARTSHVIGKEQDVVRTQLMRNRIDLIQGHGRFLDAHTVLRRGTDPRRTHHRQRRIHRDRHRHQAGPPDRCRVRRRPGAGLRRHPRPEVAADHDGGGGRRRDRHRVRLDVRRTGHQGDRRGKARQHARLLRPRDHRGAEVPPARPRGDVPVRRGGHRRRRWRRGHGHHPGQRQADPRRHGDVLGGPARPDRTPRPGQRRPRDRHPRADRRRQQFRRPRSTTSTPSGT